ncbi:secreted immunoglobulin domain 1 isoform X1 [Polypterus senegalus]|uniref:secreted immunoglobulin domain 1 isoform X1 n=1 Tax=Polypterus senegalus TaxID=55291 RepID=UPI0019640B70|nr:secreted immunoglobulin domain 1 isoform X1 [Polypterus senegalus]
MSSRNMVTLRVICLLHLSLNVWSITVTSHPGDRVSLTCPLTCLVPSTYKRAWYKQLRGQPPEQLLTTFWSYKNNYTIQHNTDDKEHFTSKKNHTLIIKSVKKDDTGKYYCTFNKWHAYVFFNEGIELIVADESSSWLVWISSTLGTMLVLMTCVTICTVYKLKRKEGCRSDKLQNQRDMRSRASDSQVMFPSQEQEGYYQELSHMDHVSYDALQDHRTKRKTNVDKSAQ